MPVDFLTTEQTESMADSPVNRMSFSWHDIFTLMKQTRIYPEKSGGDPHNRLGIALLEVGCVRFFWAPSSPI